MSAKLKVTALAMLAGLALAACETTTSTGLVQPGVDDQPTGKVARTDANALDPKDDLELGKLHYQEKNYGLAEKHYRLAIEKTPQNAEAWLGLAAAYDQLRRFELADRAYKEVFRYDGPSAAAFNNRGYSYLMRGDLVRAHKDFLSAKRLAPDSVQIANNLRLLEARRAGRGR